MKTLVVLAALVALSCAPALAADGKVAHSSLVKMGLSGMQPMSDAKGLEIRGTAYDAYSQLRTLRGQLVAGVIYLGQKEWDSRYLTVPGESGWGFKAK